MTANYSKVGKTLLLLAVFCFSAFIFFYDLDQGSLIGDDVIYILAGTEYLQGDFHRNLIHPFLGKYLIGLSVQLLGRSDLAAKLPGAFFGFLTGLVLFLFVRELTNFYVGLGATCLWSVSPMYKYFRTAHLDAFFVFFLVLSLYLFWRFSERGEIKYALLSGLAFGLALSSKFTAAILMAVILPYFVVFHLKDKSSFINETAKLALSLLVALCVFLLVYSPTLNHLGEILFTNALSHWSREQSYGHRIAVNGVVYDNPPWWIYLYWYRERYSPALLVLFGSGIAFGLLRRKRIDILLLLSLLMLYSFFFLFSAKFPRYLAPIEPSLITLACLLAFSACTYFEQWTKRKGADVLAGILFVSLLAHPGFVAVQKIVDQGPTRDKAVAGYLEPVIAPEATILIWGTPHVLKWYLGETAMILGGPRTESLQDKYEADYIVVDPWASASWPGDPLARYLDKGETAYSRCSVGGFALYIRHSLAADTYLAWAKRYETMGDLAKARTEYRKVLEVDPKNEIALDALVYYDFIDNLTQADITAPEQPFVHVESLILTMPYGGDWRRTLLAHPPSRVSYRLKIPAEPSSLHFSLAMAPESWDWGGDGGTFEIYLKDETGERLLFSEHIGNDQEDRRWHNREVSLTPYANREVEIAFVTTPGPKDDFTGDRAGWGEPQVWFSDGAVCP